MRVKRVFKTTCRRPPSQNVSAQQEGNVFGPLDPNDQIQVSSLKALPSFARLVFSRKMVDDVEVPSGWFSFDCLYFCWRLGVLETSCSYVMAISLSCQK